MVFVAIGSLTLFLLFFVFFLFGLGFVLLLPFVKFNDSTYGPFPIFSKNVCDIVDFDRFSFVRVGPRFRVALCEPRCHISVMALITSVHLIVFFII